MLKQNDRPFLVSLVFATFSSCTPIKELEEQASVIAGSWGVSLGYGLIGKICEDKSQTLD